MKNPMSIKEAIQSLLPTSTGVIQGQIISDSPLKIQVVNDMKLVLSGNNLCIPQSLSDYKVKIDNEEVTVYNSLKTGDKVWLLSFNEGKKYYILDRST